MQNEKYITCYVNRKEVMIEKSTIVYVISGEEHKTKMYTTRGEVYILRMALNELESKLGDEFIKIRRNTLVKASQIESITDSINLKNGEKLKYTARQKHRIIEEVLQKTSSH